MFGFKYYLFTPSYVANQHTETFNKVYQTWKNSFTELLSASGAKVDPDDFFRNTYVGAVMRNEDVVCSSTMTMFDLRHLAARDHHYIQALKPGTIDKLKEQNIFRLISIEYLNVLPEWRKSHSQILWTEVLIGLGLKMMDESPADAILGMPRTEVKVVNVCLNLEAREIQEPIMKMNYPCAIVIFDKKEKRQFKNEVTNQYVHSLWDSRILTHQEERHEAPKKKQAS